MERENPARRLNRRSWLAFAMIAGLVVLHQFLLQPALIRMATDAPAINFAGRQRMLSQRLAKSSLAMINAKDVNFREMYRTELADSLELWSSAHRILQAGDKSIGISRPRNHEIEKGYVELEPHFQAMAGAAKELLANDEFADNQTALKTLLIHEPLFLTHMHAIVGLYEVDANRHIRQLQGFGLIIMVVILVAQLSLQLGVVRPEVRIVGREWAQSEAHYQLLVESMTDGLIVFDQQSRIEFANQPFGKILGRSTDKLIGKPASILISDPDRRRFQLLLTEAAEFCGPLDLQLQAAEGRVVETMVSPRRMVDIDGNPTRLLLVVTDVTARKAVEQRSRELQTQLAHADRLKSLGAMAAALAHEINQPLGAIANYAEGCLNRLSSSLTDPQELVAPLKALLRSTHRGGEIIRRTLSFVRPGPHQFAAESVNDLVKEVAELCQPEARRRNIHVEWQLREDLPSVLVDGIQIQQVLTNLIQNAFEALERVDPFRRRIKLMTQQVLENELELSVADSGPGLPASGSESWFEPFVTIDKDGTGLGLSIARSIVESHGGRIWADVGRDGGAVFRFTLPINPPTASSCDLPPKEASCAG